MKGNDHRRMEMRDGMYWLSLVLFALAGAIHGRIKVGIVEHFQETNLTKIRHKS